MGRRVLLALTVLTLVSPAAALPPERETWVRAASAHFVFYSNAGEARVRALARDLEHLVDALARRKGARASPVPTSIFVFRDDRSFEPYKLNPDGSVRSLSGFFAQHDVGNYVALDGGVETPRLVLHEYLHQFATYNLPPLPVWFQEGLAEYYSTFRGTDLAVQVGRPVAEHVHWLRRNTLIPLPRLFAVTQDSPEYNEAEPQGVFYAQSWALVHLLSMGRAERRAQYKDFMDRLARGQAPEEALAAFGDVPALEAELKAYVRQDAFTFGTTKFEDRTVDVGVRFESLPRAEALFRLGDLLLRTSERRQDAVAHFRGALALAPDHAGALGGLALLDADAGRWEEAVAGFARAVAAAPDDPELRLRLAQSLYSVEAETGAPWSGDGVPERILQAREHASRAVALRPDGFEGQYLLGLSYSFQRDGVEPGIAALERARSMAPGHLGVLRALGALQAVAGRLDAARTTFEEVLRRATSREETTEARAALAEVAVSLAIEEGSRTDDRARAAAAIRAALPDIAPERRADVEDLLARVEGKATTPPEVVPRPALESGDAEAHLRYAMQQSQAADRAGGEDGVRLAGEAVKHFRRAVEIDPSSAAAWIGMAISCVRAHCPTKDGLEAAEKGVALLPDDVWGNLALANYRIDAGQYEEARNIVLSLWSVDHSMRGDLQYTHVRARVAEARSLAERGKTAEALRLLEGGPFPEGEYAQEAKRWVAEVREGVELRHWSDRLVAGSNAREKGQPETARKILEDIIANCPDKELVKMADQELAYIRAASKFK